MKFSEKIVRLRKTKGMTQEELAEAVGVSRQAVYKWECGQSYPEVAKLLEIKLLFGISIDDLLDENYEVAAPEKKRRKRAPKVVNDISEAQVIKEEKEAYTVIEQDVAEKIFSEEENKAAAEQTADTAPEVNENIPSATAEETKKTEKKRGFFARLFGRK